MVVCELMHSNRHGNGGASRAETLTETVPVPVPVPVPETVASLATTSTWYTLRPKLAHVDVELPPRTLVLSARLAYRRRNQWRNA